MYVPLQAFERPRCVGGEIQALLPSIRYFDFQAITHVLWLTKHSQAITPLVSLPQNLPRKDFFTHRSRKKTRHRHSLISNFLYTVTFYLLFSIQCILIIFFPFLQLLPTFNLSLPPTHPLFISNKPYPYSPSQCLSAPIYYEKQSF